MQRTTVVGGRGGSLARAFSIHNAVAGCDLLLVGGESDRDGDKTRDEGKTISVVISSHLPDRPGLCGRHHRGGQPTRARPHLRVIPTSGAASRESEAGRGARKRATVRGKPTLSSARPPASPSFPGLAGKEKHARQGSNSQQSSMAVGLGRRGGRYKRSPGELSTISTSRLVCAPGGPADWAGCRVIASPAGERQLDRQRGLFPS